MPAHAININNNNKSKAKIFKMTAKQVTDVFSEKRNGGSGKYVCKIFSNNVTPIECGFTKPETHVERKHT